MSMATRIALGSGKIYMAEPPETLETTNPESLITTYAVPENEFAAVKNGATVEYTPETYTAEDDMGRFSKTVNQNETATLSSGVMTISGDVFDKLVDTGRVSTTSGGTQVIKIGGLENSKNKSYLIIFEHLDKKDGNIYVILVGKNTASLSLQFQPGSETILNPTFTAEGMDDDGTKLLIIMQKPAAQSGE